MLLKKSMLVFPFNCHYLIKQQKVYFNCPYLIKQQKVNFNCHYLIKQQKMYFSFEALEHLYLHFMLPLSLLLPSLQRWKHLSSFTKLFLFRIINDPLEFARLCSPRSTPVYMGARYLISCIWVVHIYNCGIRIKILHIQYFSQ